MSSLKRSITFSLIDSDITIVERLGKGKNVSAKLSGILREYSEVHESIVKYDGKTLVWSSPTALPVYIQDDDEGTKEWSPLPFAYNKKKGPGDIPATAEEAGYLCQVIKCDGFIAYWVSKARKTCIECRRRVAEAME